MIEQVYCTHCTYGTSALEQREGELADRVLGYSARAGSQERNELRNDYRSIERFLYYYLPSDTPPEEKQRLDAAAAPRRLFFCPSMGKLQMVGQVAYRQYDTADRLGSYFAHVLFSEVSSGIWSACDCLRLWGAPWVEEDSPNHPYKLSPLARLDDLWAGTAPVVSDAALLRFLQTSVESPTDGGDAAITSRWRAAPAQQRIDLLVNSLQGLLALGMPRRENVLLVVEPSVAALVFYGVARLLPRSLNGGLSVSTYEPNAERLPVTLAATTFFDPENTDVRSDLYRRRGLVINSYQDRISEAGVPAGDYARFIVEQLLEEGWSTVDRLLESFEASGAKRPEDLEILAPTHRIVSQVLSDVPPENDSWRKSEVAARYLSREVRHELATAEAGWPKLRQVIGTPNHLTVLELVTADGTAAELQRPAQFLLKKFPPEKIAELVSSPFVGRPAKLEALVSYVTSLGQFPEGCQLFLSGGVRATTAESLLPALLSRLPEPVIRRLYETADDAKKMEFFAALVSACRSPSPAPSALKRPVVDILASLSDGQLLEVLVRHRDELRACCPPPEPALARRLGRALFVLPEHPRNFEKWLSALEPWKGYFQFPNLAERRMAEWSKVRACLLALRDREGEAAGGRVERLKSRFRQPSKTDFKPLAEALGHAMPRRTSELDELAEVADRCALDVPQFKARLELASRKAGFPIRYDDEPSAAGASADGNDLFGGPGGEVEQLRKRREQQARLWQLFRELEERLLVYSDDSMGNRKLAALQQLGQVLVGRPDFLAEGKQRMEFYFINGVWPTAALLSASKTKHGFKPRKKRRKWAPLIAIGAAAAVVVSLGGFLALSGRTSPVRVASKSATDGPRQAPEKTRTIVKNDAPPAERFNAPVVKDNIPSNAPGPDDSNEPSDAPVPKAPKDNQDTATPSAVPPPIPVKKETTPAEAVPSVPPQPAGETPSTEKPATMTETQPRTTGKEPENATGRSAQKANRIVSDYCSLPVHGSTFLATLPIKKWPAGLGSITLAIKGLSVANERLVGRCELRAESRSEGLAMAINISDGQNGAPSILAMLTTTDNALSFQWVASAQGIESAEEARRQLRRCVVEAAAETETTYLSLVAPIRREPLGMINGTARLELRPLQSDEFQFDASDELLLGYGYVELSGGQKLAFGIRNCAGKAASINDLPDEYLRSQAQVALHTSVKNPFDCDLRLTEEDTLPEELQPLSADEREVLKVIKDRLPKLKNFIGKLRSWQQQQILMTIDEHVRSLGKTLRITNLPTRSVTPTGETKQFLQEIRTRIIEPANRRRDELVKRQNAVDAFHQKQHAQFKDLTTHVVKVAAIIYRRVDADIFVPCLMLGDPAQIAGKPTPVDEGAQEDN